jgi:hypothetical protein
MQEVPVMLRTWSADEVAECLDGITVKTYQELWQKVVESEHAGTDKPSGGDGSDGTFEEPVITEGEYGTDLVAVWPLLSDAARQNICDHAPVYDGPTYE